MHLIKKYFPVNPPSAVFGIRWHKHSLSRHSPSQAMAFLSACVQQPGHPVDHLTWFKLNCIKTHRMFSGLSNASGTFEHDVPLAGRKELAGGQETALCLLYLIVTIFCSLLSAEAT